MMIPLKHLYLLPDGTDASTLEKEPLLDLLRGAFGFLSALVEISVENDNVIVTLPDEKVSQAEEATQIPRCTG